MARVTVSEDRGGRDIVFGLDGERYRAGAASARCFRDIQAQFSKSAALDTIVSAVQLMETVRARWPDARGPQLARGEHEVLGEAMLLAGGVRDGVIEALCEFGNYRNNRGGTFRLADFGFSPPSTHSIPGAREPRYWRIGTFPTDRSEDWWAGMRDGNFVAVGWDQLGELTTLIYDPDALEHRAAQTYPKGDPKHVRRTVTRFVAAPHVGDIVVPAAGMTNLAVGRICGEYAFVPQPLPHAPHHRVVEWLTTDPWPAHVPADRKVPEGFQRTFEPVIEPTTLSDIDRRGGIKPLLVGVPYRRANENVTTSEAEPFAQDPNEVDKARRGHNRTQNCLADLVERCGLQALSGDQTLGFDLAWWKGASLCVAEVKSLPVKSEENQLRLGLGQVLRYRHALSRDGVDVVAVLAVEREPNDSAWTQVCASAGVVLVWPAVQDGRLVDAGLL